MAVDQEVEERGVAERSGERFTGAGRLRARRQPQWIAAGVLAMCLGGLGGVVLYTEATTAQNVVVVNRALVRGETVKQGDLGVVSLGNARVLATVPGAELGNLVGKRAVFDLPAGSLVVSGQIGELPVERGRAQLGVRVAAGRIPTNGLSQGTRVLLVPIEQPPTASGPSPDPQGGIPGALAAPIVGAVASLPQAAPDGTSTLLDVSVGAADAARVAVLAGTDRLVVVKDAER